MSRTRAALAGAVALASLALSACGKESLSVTQLRSSATRICQLAVKQGNRIPGPASPAAGVGFLRGGVPVLTRELTGLRALDPPGSLKNDYNTAVNAFSQQLTLVQEMVRRLDNGADPVISFKALQAQLAPVEARGTAAWQALGIPACINQ